MLSSEALSWTENSIPAKKPLVKVIFLVYPMIFNIVFFHRLGILKFFIATQTPHYGCDQTEIVYFALEVRK